MWKNRWLQSFIAILTISLGILSITSGASASLWNYWTEQGEAFIPCGQERYNIAAELGLFNYDCSAGQNNLLEQRLRAGAQEDINLGFSVATGYRSNLSLPMTSSQSTVPVSSMALPDGTALTMALLGNDRVFLTIEPGGAKMELVMCTGISGTTFTGCTRGLSFSGTSTAAVLANQKTHNASSQVVISNVHYVYEQFADINNKDQTIDGIKTFSLFPRASSTTNLPTIDSQFATKYYVDTVGAGGFTSVNASTTRGIQVLGTSPETIGVNVSTTKGLAFSEDGSVYQKVSSTTGVSSDSNGIAVSPIGSDWATSTATANKVPIANANGTLGNWVSGFQINLIVGENVSSSEIVYVSSTNGFAYKAKANDQNTLDFIGIVNADYASGTSAQVITNGVVNGLSNLATGTTYYLSDTSSIRVATGTYEVKIGSAISNTQLLIERGREEYIGNASFSCYNNLQQTCNTVYVTVPTLARYGIINGSAGCSSNGGGCGNTDIDSVINRTNASLSFADYGIDTQMGTPMVTAYFTWVTNTISIYATQYVAPSNNGGGSTSGIIHFYR